jgi:hypothetical protein
MHGSCRIPHGNGADALPMLDTLIDQGAEFRRQFRMTRLGERFVDARRG